MGFIHDFLHFFLVTMVALKLIPLILSGGAGTRLWPLSREAAPKPFMPLPDGETLLGKTARRALDLPHVARLLTVTNRDLYFHTKDVYASAGLAPRASYQRFTFGKPARSTRCHSWRATQG